MTVDELKAYARAGLTARLEALAREQHELRALLASITPEASIPSSRDDVAVGTPVRATSSGAARTMSDEGRKRIGDAARRRWAAVRTAASDALAGSAPSDTPEPDVARVLPRRGRTHRAVGQSGEPAAASTAPTLPPMPRLVKAQAS